MWLFLADNDNIAGFHTWELIGLSVELVLVIIWSALIDLDVDDLLLLLDLFTIAFLAFVLFVNNLSLPSAFVARALALSVHSRSKLLHFDDHTSTLARRTLLDSSLFAAPSLAGCAYAFSVYGNFCLLPCVNLL